MLATGNGTVMNDRVLRREKRKKKKVDTSVFQSGCTKTSITNFTTFFIKKHWQIMVKVVKFQEKEKGIQLNEVECTFKRILFLLMAEHDVLKHDN